jgi:hypothetical protein
MTAQSRRLTQLIWSAIGGDPSGADGVTFVGEGGLPAIFPVTDVASAAVATAALSLAELLQHANGDPVPVTIDRRLTSIWFQSSIRPLDWTLPASWDALAGDYETRDGWIRLHTNAPHHRAAAERVLGAHSDKPSIARAVRSWAKSDLENAIVEQNGCAAEMRSVDEWERHPQGQAIAAEPLVHLDETDGTEPAGWTAPMARPLQGLRVLDLTRVLAGPVASRFLAGYGAQVLRIDPPHWQEPSIVPEITLGKRCARLDLTNASDRTTFERLLSNAHILIHGYRPGALDGLGYGSAIRRKLSPGLIEVCLDAYGWSGPWAMRRGFDSLVQMSSGIADAGMRRNRAGRPLPLPVQALDHATGYMMAAAAISGFARRLAHAKGREARLSLARTAKLLVDQGTHEEDRPLASETDADRSPNIEGTAWGRAQRIASPIHIEGVAMRWDCPAGELGTADAQWL